jgi:hypothetical protein
MALLLCGRLSLKYKRGHSEVESRSSSFLGRSRLLFFVTIAALIAGIVLSIMFNSLFIFLFLPFGFGWGISRKSDQEDDQELKESHEFGN